MQEVIEQELSIGQETRDGAAGLGRRSPTPSMRMACSALIERIGKGRFAQALAPHVTEDTCPDYIRQALEHIRDAVA